mmetsp:Transcript_8417/g.11352  ORF Transcript_8417/g.11352 Transcript_8417/m.11352 type:complete len:560 (+) Transcript_8417:52-1731(+)
MSTEEDEIQNDDEDVPVGSSTNRVVSRLRRHSMRSIMNIVFSEYPLQKIQALSVRISPTSKELKPAHPALREHNYLESPPFSCPAVTNANAFNQFPFSPTSIKLPGTFSPSIATPISARRHEPLVSWQVGVASPREDSFKGGSRRGSVGVSSSHEDSIKGASRKNSIGREEAIVGGSRKNSVYREEAQVAGSRKVSSASAVGHGGANVNHDFIRGRDIMSLPFVSKLELQSRTDTIRSMYMSSPRENRKVRAIERLSRLGDNGYVSLKDKIIDELMLTGRLYFDYCTPSATGAHACYFTAIFLLMCITVFSYMSGIYPYWMIKDAGINSEDVYAIFESQPGDLLQWIIGGGRQFKLHSKFLTVWGARDLSTIYDKQYVWRWLTSVLIHDSHEHLWGNMIIFVILSAHLENKYGTLPITIIATLSGIGGNFLSALVEDKCVVVMGASGLVYGLMGVYIADFVLNFESVRRPLMQGACILAAVIYLTTTTVLNDSRNSHFSHIGGCVSGFFPGLMLLPNFHEEDWEAVIPYLAFFGVSVTLLALPILIYINVLPYLDCISL